MALVWTSNDYPSGAGWGLGDNWDVEYNDAVGGFSNNNTSTYGLWVPGGTTSYQTGQTVVTQNYNTTLQNAYGAEAVTRIKIMVELDFTTVSGQNYIVVCPTTTQWGYSGGNEYSIDVNVAAKDWYTFDHSVASWGVNPTQIQNIIDGTSGWGIRVRCDGDNNSGNRGHKVYRIRISVQEDTLYEPASSGGSLLGGSF
jgi:hypothetical protein